MIIQIEALYFLLLVESALILLVLSLYLFSQKRKYKKLYEKGLKDLESAGSGSIEQGEPQSRTSEVLTGISEGERGEARQEAGPEQGMPEVPAGESIDVLQADGGMPQSDEGFDVTDGDPSAGRVRRLQRMVIFQKNTILELMCYKDIFEGAQMRLTALQQTNNELQEKIRSLTESGVVENVGIAEPLNAFESNSHELEKFIGILDRENGMLSEKFRVWEEEFKRISEDTGNDGDVPGVDESKYIKIAKEKEELIVKVKDLEQKLQEKGSEIDALKQQYEDLEKEYMILYRQQQQQQQQQ